MNNKDLLTKTGMNLYGSLQNYIKTNIINGTYPEGSSLPTEKWFSDHFGISRVTVRKAIDVLIDEGIIIRDKGKSPTVPVKRFNRSFNKLTGFSEQLIEDGHIPSAKILEFKTIKAPSKIAKLMKINDNDEIVYIKRIRYSDGQAITLQNIYLNRKYSLFLIEHDLLYKSLYTIMESKGVSFNYADQLVKAEMPSSEERQLLGLDNKTPVLKTDRITYHKNGDVIEYVTTCCNSNKYNIKVELYR